MHLKRAKIVSPIRTPDDVGYQWITNPFPPDSVDEYGQQGLNNAGNETLLKIWVARQPVVVFIYGSMLGFSYYSGGENI